MTVNAAVTASTYTVYSRALD
ncbi:MAG: hypothetical protein JWM25_1920, partial [Thermoleophilia bacterium]|nr:hypothetical protein [Thermoleophilia bacterium]